MDWVHLVTGGDVSLVSMPVALKVWAFTSMGPAPEVSIFLVAALAVALPPEAAAGAAVAAGAAEVVAAAAEEVEPVEEGVGVAATSEFEVEVLF